jgi:2-polyprenyl-3-methyl-5-hydroxy-6-metoxy-1,4-benzoquinol methylase
MSFQAPTPQQGGAESHWSAFDAAGIQRLLAAEDQHFWFRARNETLAALASPPMHDLREGFRVLEVGCGSGNVLRVLKRLAGDRGHVEGLELSTQAADVARGRTGLSITNGYVSDLDQHASYDLIAAFDVLEHIANDTQMLIQIRERLAPGGRLILTVPAHQSLWSEFDIASGHERRYSKTTLFRALRASGFEVEYVTYFMSLLFPPMWLRRRLVKKGKRDIGAPLDSEFQIVPGINRIAYELLRREAPLVGRRWHLPMGTSLAAIARRPL